MWGGGPPVAFSQPLHRTPERRRGVDGRVSTSTSIVSLAADLVVFLAAASLLLVLLLRPDLLGVTALFRAVLSGAAALLALAAVIHGGLDEQGAWLSTLRLAAVVLLAVGCLGVTARWPRTALLASLALLVVAEIVHPQRRRLVREPAPLPRRVRRRPVAVAGGPPVAGHPHRRRRRHPPRDGGAGAVGGPVPGTDQQRVGAGPGPGQGAGQHRGRPRREAGRRGGRPGQLHRQRAAPGRRRPGGGQGPGRRRPERLPASS